MEEENNESYRGLHYLLPIKFEVLMVGGPMWAKLGELVQSGS